jgi:hypothetical protein
MRQQHEIGAELRAALEERGCALGAAEARALSILLIDLIADGLIAADDSETAPAYNMGQSKYNEGGDRG